MTGEKLIGLPPLIHSTYVGLEDWELFPFRSGVASIINPIIDCKYCQALSISQFLNLSLSLRDRDRADTIITLYHTTPQQTF